MIKMPRSFLIKKNNYSNCPLKKRPLCYDFEEDKTDEVQEPENLSTKPQDLSVNSPPPKTVSPPPLVSPHPVKYYEADHHPLLTPPPYVSSLPPPTLLAPTPLLPKSNGPLEPLSLNPTAPGPYPAWPRGLYPPYLPFNFPYPTPTYPRQADYQYPLYPISPGRPTEQQLSPYAPQDSVSPPPQQTSLEGDFHHIHVTPTSTPPSSPTPAEDLSQVKKARAKDGGPRYECTDCQKSYSTFSGLSKHRQFHCVTQAKKSFSCKYCEKVYVSLGALKMHIRTHTLPCKCTLCGKAFSRPWLLQGHIRTHTGEKPFSCPHCNRAFADRSNLRAHLQTHSDVKKYSCKTCSKTFSRMSLLVKHEDGVCPGVMQLPSPGQ